jgi:chromosome segregation ATPase
MAKPQPTPCIKCGAFLQRAKGPNPTCKKCQNEIRDEPVREPTRLEAMTAERDYYREKYEDLYKQLNDYQELIDDQVRQIQGYKKRRNEIFEGYELVAELNDLERQLEEEKESAKAWERRYEVMVKREEMVKQQLYDVSSELADLKSRLRSYTTTASTERVVLA